MQKRIASVVVDTAAAMAVGVGIAILLLPLVLHLWLGIDNDAYIVIAEAASRDPVILLQAGLEWMFRVDFVLWPALLIFAGLGLRWLVRSWSGVESPL